MEPITKKQSDYLVKLGHKENQPKTKEEASKLINKLKTIQMATQIQGKGKLHHIVEADIDTMIDEVIFAYAKVLKKCTEAGICEPAAVGMILNNVMSKL